MVPSAFITAHFYGSEFDEAVRFLLIFTCVTVPDLVYGVVLYQLAIGKTRCFGHWLARCWAAARYCCTLIMIIFVCMSTGVCYLILHTRNLQLGPLFQPILEGRLISAVIWFPIWLVLPCQLGYLSLWNYEHNKAQTEAQKAAQRMQTGSATGADEETVDAPDTELG